MVQIIAYRKEPLTGTTYLLGEYLKPMHLRTANRLIKKLTNLYYNEVHVNYIKLVDIKSNYTKKEINVKV